MIIRRTSINLLTYPINRWMVSYILDTKSKHYNNLLRIIVGACNDNTQFRGDFPYQLDDVLVLYNECKTVKQLHTIEHDAISNVQSAMLLSYKNPFDVQYHMLTLTVRWSEGEYYIYSIDKKINEYLKHNCFFPIKLKLPKEK